MRIEELKKFHGLNPAVDFLLGKLDGDMRETALVEMVFHLCTQLQMLEAAKTVNQPKQNDSIQESEPRAFDPILVKTDPIISLAPEKPSNEVPGQGDIEPRILPIEGKSERMRKLDEDWEPREQSGKKKRGWRW